MASQNLAASLRIIKQCAAADTLDEVVVLIIGNYLDKNWRSVRDFYTNKYTTPEGRAVAKQSMTDVLGDEVVWTSEPLTKFDASKDCVLFEYVEQNLCNINKRLAEIYNLDISLVVNVNTTPVSAISYWNAYPKCNKSVHVRIKY